MQYFYFFLVAIAAIFVVLYIKAQLNKIEYTRVGCSIGLALLEGVGEKSLVMQHVHFKEGVGLCVTNRYEFIGQTYTKILDGESDHRDVDKIKVCEIQVVRIPFTQIHTGVIKVIIDVRGDLYPITWPVVVVGREVFL